MSSTLCEVWETLSSPDIGVCFRVSLPTFEAPVALIRSPWTVTGA